MQSVPVGIVNASSKIPELKSKLLPDEEEIPDTSIPL
jgi:hypothetical protein